GTCGHLIQWMLPRVLDAGRCHTSRGTVSNVSRKARERRLCGVLAVKVWRSTPAPVTNIRLTGTSTLALPPPALDLLASVWVERTRCSLCRGGAGTRRAPPWRGADRPLLSRYVGAARAKDRGKTVPGRNF